jgi:uncharacterized protein YcfJ
MRKLILVTMLASLSGLAEAAPDAAMQMDWAPVVSTTAIYARVNNPRQECWTDQVTREVNPPPEHNYGGAILGGLVGGLLGHTVGNGSGKDAATAVGAVTGAVVGNNLTNQGASGGPVQQTSEERHCRAVDNWSRQITGYSVKYQYNGQEHRTVLSYDPGTSLRVRVHIVPAEMPPGAGNGYAPPPPNGGYAPPPPPSGYAPPPPNGYAPPPGDYGPPPPP